MQRSLLEHGFLSEAVGGQNSLTASRSLAAGKKMQPYGFAPNFPVIAVVSDMLANMAPSSHVGTSVM
jgi:hypothetical protein